MKDKEYLTTRELAEAVGVSARTIYNALDRGLIKEPARCNDGRPRHAKFRHRRWSLKEADRVQRLFEASGSLEFGAKVRRARAARKAAAGMAEQRPEVNFEPSQTHPSVVVMGAQVESPEKPSPASISTEGPGSSGLPGQSTAADAMPERTVKAAEQSEQQVIESALRMHGLL